MPVYLLKATQVPAVPVYSGLITPADLVTTVARTLVAGDTSALLTKFNQNAAALDVTGRHSGGCYAVAQGLDLSSGGGLTLSVSAGQAMIDGPVTLKTGGTLALSDNVYSASDITRRIYIWLSQAAALVQVPNSTAKPNGAHAYLGSVRTNAGAIVDFDYSGRLAIVGGVPQRRCADVAIPQDSPPATSRFFHQATRGLYYWDGVQYWGLSPSANGVRQVVTLARAKVSIPAYSANYRIEADFGASGVFDNVCYSVSVQCDESGPIISEETNRKTTGRLSIVIFVPQDAVIGTYGGALDLELTTTLEGRGWTGDDDTDVPASWSIPDPVLP